MSLTPFFEEEFQRVIDAENRYGNFYVNAYNATIMLSNIMMWPVIDCDIFIRFLSQMKKYHTLSMISTVRLHRIQAKLDLRYFLESTANAAFALAHVDTKNYFNFAASKQPDAQKATAQAYKWIDATYSNHSKFIKQTRDQINEQTAHANVFNSQHNFKFVPGERSEIHTSFFDFEDDRMITADLWQCAHAGLMAVDLILAVQKQYGGFLPSVDVDDLGQLIADNNALWIELDAKIKSEDAGPGL